MAWRRPSDPSLAANKPVQAASEAKSARPSVPPTRGSIRFSGCGIKPSTLNRSLNTPAIELMAPLGLVSVPDPALSVAIAERDPAFRLDSADGVVIGDEVSLAVGNGEFDHLSRRVTTREWSLRVLDPDMLHFADEAQLRVAHQNAGQKTGLAQDLEAIADAQHQSAARRVIADRPHDRRPGGDRAAAQIIAVGESARQDDQIQARRQFVFGMPDDSRLGAGGLPKRARDVAFAINAGKQDDRRAHPPHAISMA